MTLFVTEAPFSDLKVYPVLAGGVDHLRMRGERVAYVDVILGLSEHPNSFEFTHPYAFEDFIRGVVTNPKLKELVVELVLLE